MHAVVHDDACVLGAVMCPPHHNCLPWDQHLQGAVCIRLCSSGNGGCGKDQACVEEPYCSDCELRAVMNGRCVNLATGMTEFVYTVFYLISLSLSHPLPSLSFSLPSHSLSLLSSLSLFLSLTSPFSSLLSPSLLLKMRCKLCQCL